MRRYVSSYGIQDNDMEALQYYGAYCTDKALEKFTQYDNSEGEMTVTGLKANSKHTFCLLHPLIPSINNGSQLNKLTITK